jgi:hypothetical protein
MGGSSYLGPPLLYQSPSTDCYNQVDVPRQNVIRSGRSPAPLTSIISGASVELFAHSGGLRLGRAASELRAGSTQVGDGHRHLARSLGHDRGPR